MILNGIWPASAMDGSAFQQPAPRSKWRRLRGNAAKRASAGTAKPKPLPPLRGTALVFGRFFRPQVETGDYPPGTLFMFLPGCLDESLNKIKSGKQSFELRIAHRPGTHIATARDGALLFYAVGNRLRRCIRRDCPAGRRLAAKIKATGCKEFSVGATMTEGFVDQGGRVLVTRARLNEISLARKGACPGCRLDS